MLSEYPIIRAIIIKNPDRNAEPITDFRKLYEPVQKRLNAARILQNRGEIAKASAEKRKLPKNWVLLDYFDVIVHVFKKDERDYYGIERLWADAPIIELNDETN